MVEIRRYKKGDEGVLWSLFYHAVHLVAKRDYTDEQLRAWAPRDVDKCQWREKIAAINPYIVEHGQDILGYGDLQQDGYIIHFFCHHDWQRRGVGSLLMRKLHEEAKTSGVSRLYANVSITANPFFLAQGFVVAKEQLVSIRGQILKNFSMQKYI